MMLDGLQALHVRVAQLTQEFHSWQLHLILRSSVLRGDRDAQRKRTRLILVASRYNDEVSHLRSHAKIDSINLSRLSRHAGCPAQIVVWRVTGGDRRYRRSEAKRRTAALAAG